MANSIVVGAEFSSFEALSQSLSDWEKATYTSLYVGSSHTVISAQKRVPKKVFSEALKYYEVDFACVHGGRRALSKSKGARPNQR